MGVRNVKALDSLFNYTPPCLAGPPASSDNGKDPLSLPKIPQVFSITKLLYQQQVFQSMNPVALIFCSFYLARRSPGRYRWASMLILRILGCWRRLGRSKKLITGSGQIFKEVHIQISWGQWPSHCGRDIHVLWGRGLFMLIFCCQETGLPF